MEHGSGRLNAYPARGSIAPHADPLESFTRFWNQFRAGVWLEETPHARRSPNSPLQRLTIMLSDTHKQETSAAGIFLGTIIVLLVCVGLVIVINDWPVFSFPTAPILE